MNILKKNILSNHFKFAKKHKLYYLKHVFLNFYLSKKFIFLYKIIYLIIE